ncbi:putative exocyst complex component EXO70B1 [Cocos nucifera]|uniref:Putative exocyst complex component EXO70B1 n=1 Tax=Cocos nucifera TaxID=13894 RepID=A0A8K0IU03_COCNU|nr:putative exocyst complex component EXO70B1 [Cocos nucifera]
MSESGAKALARPAEEAVAGGSGSRTKRARFDRCFSGLEIKMEPGPLKELDPEKLKSEIKRWAKAVVAYARQLSSRFGSPRERSDSRSDSQRGGRPSGDR